MKIYTYEGKANISGDRIHQARTAQMLILHGVVLPPCSFLEKKISAEEVFQLLSHLF